MRQAGSEALIVDADYFWTLMCDPRFIRLSPLCGRVGNEVYVTLEAPESIPGFIDQQIASVSKAIWAH